MDYTTDFANIGAADNPSAPSSPANLYDSQEPSPWIQRWSHLVRPSGSVLDVACGRGRHAYWFFERNHPLTVIDRAQFAIDSIAIPAAACNKIVADVENGPWPLTGHQFDGVVVTNYLWRPLMPVLLASLAPGGVLIYETFAQGNETVGKPSNANFLLRPGELLEACQNLRVVAFEDGFLPSISDMTARFVQRITAVKLPESAIEPVRHLLV